MRGQLQTPKLDLLCSVGPPIKELSEIRILKGFLKGFVDTLLCCSE